MIKIKNDNIPVMVRLLSLDENDRSTKEDLGTFRYERNHSTMTDIVREKLNFRH